MSELEMPNDVEIEKKLICAMLLKEGSIIPRVATLVSEEDFYRTENRLIFRAMLNIYNRGVPPDLLLVENELRRMNAIKKVSRFYLFSLTDLEYTTARAEAQAKEIHDKAILRRLIMSGEEIIDEAQDPRNTVDTVLDSAEKKILSVTTRSNDSDFEALDVVLQKTFERIQFIHNHPNSLAGVTTGLIDLDRVMNGLQKSDLILLAARPSMGKTALALNIAANAARSGKVVMLFSLEMSKIQLGNRLLSSESGVDSHKMNTGGLTNEDINLLINSMTEMERMKLFIDDTAGITLLEMRSKSRRLKFDQGLDLIVIDYLQLMQGGHSRLSEQNRQQEISEISRNLKALAREMNVPVLALSQLSRSVEMRAEKKPQLSDLRESGSLEQDADIVMFLYRDEYYNRDAEDNKNLAELIIAKNRNGPTTSVRLQFQKEIMRFQNFTRVER